MKTKLANAKLIITAIYGIVLMLGLSFNVFSDPMKCWWDEFSKASDSPYYTNNCPGSGGSGFCSYVLVTDQQQGNTCTVCYAGGETQSCDQDPHPIGNVECNIYRSDCSGSGGSCGAFSLAVSNVYYPCHLATGSFCLGRK